MPIVELENFKFKSKKRNALKKEGRIIWEQQNYPDFLEVNEPFYGDTGDEQAKRDFYLSQQEIHFHTAFRILKKENGKADYDKATNQPKTTGIPCKWQLKLYFKNGQSVKLYYSHNDENTLATVNYFLHQVVKNRINPEGKWTKRFEHQEFKKALLIDRYLDEIVFQYPAQNAYIPSFEDAQKELLKITKYFKKKKDFPPYEYYAEEFEEEEEEIVMRPTPKVGIKQKVKEEQQVTNTVTPQTQNNSFLGAENNALTLYGKVINSVIRTLCGKGVNNFTIPLLDLSFGRYDAQNKTLTVLCKGQEHYEEIEGNNIVVLEIRRELISCFGQEIKLQYSISPIPIKKIEIAKEVMQEEFKKEIPIVRNSNTVQVSETQPKITETETLDIPNQIIKKERLNFSYKRSPETRFAQFMSDLVTKTLCTEDEFWEIKWVSLDVESETTTISLNSHNLINLFHKSEKQHFFNLLFRSKIGGEYKLIFQK